ncbi:MAG: hypothetical protein K0S46_2200 [Moraxellaceae bacterium]|jgi:hypothetical protein|nr:hypothetical protein [Moraxellaceae bacterium]
MKAKDRLKAFGLSLWHNVGKYVFAMVLAGAVSKHLPVDSATANAIGQGTAEAITQQIGQ